ncbi:MAG: DUF2169 domain-containing protein [Byssovorax sp.]
MSTADLIPVTALDPLSAAAFPWRSGGALRLTNAAKASFDFVHEGEARMGAPAPLAQQDRARGAAAALDEASEMAPHLPSCGVTLRGHATARGAPTPVVNVSLGVYRGRWLVHKRLVVRGEVGPAGPAPFTSVPLVYERALGGPGVQANPAGTASPNIVNPADPRVPAGFGPIPPTWAPRALFAPRAPAPSFPAEVPADLDPRYFHAAPPDQQCDYLEGGEYVILEGVHPTHEVIRTRLPALSASARVWLPSPSGGPPVEQPVRMVADTLSIDADAMAISLVWRGQIELPFTEVPRSLSILVGLSRPDAPAAFPRQPPRVRSTFAGTTAVNDAEVARARAQAAAPFAVAEAGSARAPAAPIPGSPFQQAPPIAPAPLPVIAPALAPIAPAPIVTTREEASAPIAIPAAPPPEDAPNPLLPGRRARSPFAATLEQRGKPPERPIAPFPIAGAQGPRSASAPIPGAPFQEVPAAPVEIVSRGHDPPPLGELAQQVLGRARDRKPMLDLALAGADLRGLDLRAALLERQPLRGARLAGCCLASARLAGADLEGADLSGADLTGADLTGASLGGACFDGADLAGARLGGVRGTGVRLAGASLAGADLKTARLPGAIFDGARLDGASAVRCDLSGARFLRADLGEASLRGSKLQGAVFAWSTARGADLRDANLEGANLHGVDQATLKLNGANLRGVIDTPPPGAQKT